MRQIAAGFLVLALLLAGCAGQPASPAPSDPPPAPPEQSAPAEEPVMEYRREDAAALPEEVRAWVERFRQVPVGVAKRFGDRTYLLVSPPAVCPEQVSIDFWPDDTRVEQNEVIVTARFGCVSRNQTTQPFALGSIPATDLPVRFHLQYGWLPAFKNPHNLPEVPLPAGSRGVLVEPAAGATLGPQVRVSGFAAGLFEGTVVARLVTEAGKVVLEKPTIAAGGMGPDWGSFVLDLDLTGVASGSYLIEIGDYDMKDGAWSLMDQIPVVLR
ncbi:MAG: Gmad2 immunoglobulin-like domain-containing protein [Bacillota bacterium]